MQLINLRVISRVLLNVKCLIRYPDQIPKWFAAECVQHQTRALCPTTHISGSEVPPGHVPERVALL